MLGLWEYFWNQSAWVSPSISASAAQRLAALTESAQLVVSQPLFVQVTDTTQVKWTLVGGAAAATWVQPPGPSFPNWHLKAAPSQSGWVQPRTLASSSWQKK